MRSVRDVTYQVLRELNMTTIFGNAGSTEETFPKNFSSDFRYLLAQQEASERARYSFGRDRTATH
jgi:benzoylformate decarboxylase